MHMLSGVNEVKKGNQKHFLTTVQWLSGEQDPDLTRQASSLLQTLVDVVIATNPKTR